MKSGRFNKGTQRLVDPGNPVLLTDPNQLSTLSAYKPQPTSPVIDAGLDLQGLFGVDPGLRDFYGVALPQGAALDIGAAEDFLDADDDGVADDVDNCPQFSNPGQGPAAFGMDVVATAQNTFSWPVSVDAEWIRGDLAGVSSYSTSGGNSLTAATSLMDATTPSEGGGLYYLLKPSGDCAETSWQTIIGAEPARDTTLP